MTKRNVGLIYRSIWLYRAVMRLLYKNYYKDKYTMVAEAIPPGSTVIDLCCGDCVIAPYLQKKNCQYIGFDINERFVGWAKKKGIDARLWDVSTLDFPEGDVVCIQSALYQFMPNEKKLLTLMIQKARKKVIIAEPIVDWETEVSFFYKKLAMLFTQVKGQVFTKRFSEAGLQELVKDLPKEALTITSIPRELMICIDVTKLKK